MNKNKLRELIAEHKERFSSSQDLVKRESQEIIKFYIKQKEAVIITGVRRSGKSSLMRLISNDIMKEYDVPFDNILYLNFEDERFIDFSHSDFEPLYETFIELYQPKGTKYIFIDEIQNIKGWEKWVNRLYEFEDIKIFVTGSNATLLSSEIASALTGRNRQLTCFPFSFCEFLRLRGYEFHQKDLYLREKRAKIKNLFNEYIDLGGFPEVLKNKDATLLEQYLKDIIYRDVIARYKIKNIKEIRELVLFLSSNIGKTHSYNSLKDLIEVKSLNTVKNYLEILENVYLFFCVDLFDYSVKKQIYNPSKIYSIDSALSRSVAFKFSQDSGHIYENFVFIELLRRNKEIFYWKSKRGKEVDFIVKKGLKIEQAIQVSTTLSEYKTKQREIDGLLDAGQELNVKDLIIITEDDEGEEEIGETKIKLIPLWKWMLLVQISSRF
ncbi:MAG TPA: ATP-binding protein [Acidobacteriota bacterium]|nr:ATP-binding protein [Acidobacteriota bacterium]